MNVFTGAVFTFFCILSTVANAQQQCGEAIAGSRGRIASLAYPFPLNPGTVCSWTFQLPETLPKLVYLNIEEVEIAAEDKLTIFDGIQSFSYVGANVTRMLMIVLNSNGSSVQLTIGPNIAISPRRLMASYISEGASLYTPEHSEMIKSPMYTNRTATNMKFTWIITKMPDTSVYLSFRSFSIGVGRLTIDDGTEQLFFNESKLPNDIATASANVNVTLEMPLDEPGFGFELVHMQLHPNCSKYVSMDNVTEIDIDFKDLNIMTDHTVRCFIIVEGTNDVVFSAGVRALDTTIPESNTVIFLNDGGSSHSPNILVFSPTGQIEAPPDVVTSGNRLWIGYNSLVQKKPLNVTVHITVHNSGNHIRGSGSFTLPQQTPNATLASNTSMYVLSVASSDQVIVTVGKNASLSHDNYILFHDGSAKGKLLANFTANMTFYPVAASSSQLCIVAYNFKGNDTFSASFVAAKKGTNFLSSDRLDSFQLNEVETNSSYVWTIAPLQFNASAEVIALTISRASLSNERSLLIYNGTSDSATVLYTLTNFTKSIVFHIDSAEGAKVVFQNKENASSGVIVDASYQLQTKCQFSLNLTSINSTTISTPNYPGPYPVNAQCRWNIVTPSEMVYLTFVSMDLPPSQALQVYSTKDGNMKLITDISGSGIIDDVITQEAPLLLVWSSSVPLHEAKVSTGFQIDLFPLDCGGLYNDTSKEFNTPNYPKAEKNSTLCVWAVTVPPKKDDNVQIIDLAYSAGELKTSSADLIIHEGGSLQSKSANMSAINQTNFLSRTNKLLIRYMYTSDSAGGTSYQFTYNPYECNSTQVCKNGLCLHDSWRCNGVNDCGDFSDEINCAASPISPPQPAPVPAPATGISVAAFVVVMFVMVIIGAALAIGGPIAWRKFRSQRNYQEFRNTADA